ncbi:MAG TPA: purine-nucleoside phosphorylase [Gemmatimonadaceae bacterium]|nr:purine-nucleoside phosphorylase [Gemmatimonadaceae bacterium]
MRPYGGEAAREAASTILPLIGDIAPTVAIILGSGLGGLVDDVRDHVTIPYGEIPGLPGVGVEGHAGKLVIGDIEGRKVAVFAGRFHAYEGHPPQLTAFPVRIAHALGARTLFVSNAAGGVNKSFVAGDLMVIEDHLNLTFTSPLTGSAEPGETRFPDMSNAYDPVLRAQLHAAGSRLGMELRDGVYAMLPGPAYETPAEVRMLRTLGADAVGMSTVPEVTMARTLGLRVAGVSCITNAAAGIEQTPLAHAEVLETTARVAAQFQALVRAFVRSL